eukprot:56164-Chlamydomonas_euryale.AAC.9
MFVLPESRENWEKQLRKEEPCTLWAHDFLPYFPAHTWSWALALDRRKEGMQATLPAPSAALKSAGEHATAVHRSARLRDRLAFIAALAQEHLPTSAGVPAAAAESAQACFRPPHRCALRAAPWVGGVGPGAPAAIATAGFARTVPAGARGGAASAAMTTPRKVRRSCGDLRPGAAERLSAHAHEAHSTSLHSTRH